MLRAAVVSVVILVACTLTTASPSATFAAEDDSREQLLQRLKAVLEPEVSATGPTAAIKAASAQLKLLNVGREAEVDAILNSEFGVARQALWSAYNAALSRAYGTISTDDLGKVAAFYEGSERREMMRRVAELRQAPETASPDELAKMEAWTDKVARDPALASFMKLHVDVMASLVSSGEVDRIFEAAGHKMRERFNAAKLRLPAGGQ